ncbi:MAG: TonB-dependent receptor plug domain-containing protein [Ignavibacteriales bacterium]|nr:TonB-dependent receptor plug domain-containing protein [Ignavibacteriales bacterium]
MQIRHSPRPNFVYQKVIRSAFLLVCLVSAASAQDIQIPDSVKAQRLDSLRADTRKRFIPGIGNLGRPVDTSSALHHYQFLHTDAVYVGDLLWKIPGVLLREFGEPGQAGQLSKTGVDTRGISLQLDGRPLNDPVTGLYNLYDIPLEYLNEIESSDGMGALFQSPNSAAGRINFVSHQYNSSRPLTKLRFFQGAFDHILSDGIFAQNVSRGMNAVFGFQRHVTNGRFKNSAYDSWNFRLRLRYNVSEDLNMWIGDFYTKSTIGLNDGVDASKSASLYDELNATVKDLASYQISSRHDLTVGVIGRFFSDTTSLSKATLYFSSIDREYSNGNPLGGQPLFSNNQVSSFWGMKLQQNITFPVGSLDLGAEMESRHTRQDHYLADRTENYAAGSAMTMLRAGQWIEGAFSARFEGLRGDHGLSWGVNLKSRPTLWLEVWGDQSRSYRFPTIQELFWVDSDLERADNLTKETHSLIQAGTRIRTSSFELGLTGFIKKIENSISLTPWTNGEAGYSFVSTPVLDYSGVTADLKLRVSVFELAGNITFTRSKKNGSDPPVIPQITSVSELSYRDQFAGGELDLKGAIRLKAVTRHRGLQFLPRLGLFAEQGVAEMPAFASLDFYCVAKIGDAYLTFEWENPLSVNRMMIPYYPLMDRNIKLGVNWVFTD